MTGRPILSVVVSTHERPRDLARCLGALRRLDDPVEVIVVDSASRPPVGPVVALFAGWIPRLTYVFEAEPGLSRARNAGLAAASSPIVAFVDDDAVPARDWARAIAAPFERDPQIGVVGGTCRAAFAARRPRWLSDRLLCFAGITRFGGRAREARSSAEWPFGANMAYRAEALRAAGGFAETLGRIGRSLLSGEESVVIESLRRAGWKIWLEPAAVVDHAVTVQRTRSRYYWRRLWWQGVSRARRDDASLALAGRLLVAAPLRLGLYLVTGDRVFLYRLAEPAGYVVERMRRLSAARNA